MSEIVKWNTIQDQFCHGLLLGNGASRAIVDSKFNYDSIFKAAGDSHHITQSVMKIFEDFKVKDFELVLRYLWQAKLVNKALDIASKRVDDAYKEIQKALIATIREVHPSYDQIKADLTCISEYMQRFKTVVSLNYDLIVYWATQKNKEAIGNWFKDGFVNGFFVDDINSLRGLHNAKGSTLFFYPHGNLVLARTDDGKEGKVRASAECTNLLDTILRCWENNNIVPIFVCEGTSEHKKLAIESSSYLQRVYHEVIPSLDESLVIYGWSMSDQDQHILDRLEQAKENKLQRVAVSVHKDNWLYVRHVQEKLGALGIKEIIFFDAASHGCWNNPLNADAVGSSQTKVEQSQFNMCNS